MVQWKSHGNYYLKCYPLSSWQPGCNYNHFNVKSICCDRNPTGLQLQGNAFDQNESYKEQAHVHICVRQWTVQRAWEVRHKALIGASLCSASSVHGTKGPFTVQQQQHGLESLPGRSWQILQFQLIREDYYPLFDSCSSLTFTPSLTKHRKAVLQQFLGSKRRIKGKWLSCTSLLRRFRLEQILPCLMLFNEKIYSDLFGGNRRGFPDFTCGKTQTKIWKAHQNMVSYILVVALGLKPWLTSIIMLCC